MVQRRFTDRTGVSWTVHEVAGAVPTSDSLDARERREEPRSAQRDSRVERLATRPLELSRLCFESSAERRFLDNFPADWTELPDDELEDLLTAS